MLAFAIDTAWFSEVSVSRICPIESQAVEDQVDNVEQEWNILEGEDVDEAVNDTSGQQCNIGDYFPFSQGQIATVDQGGVADLSKHWEEAN